MLEPRCFQKDRAPRELRDFSLVLKRKNDPRELWRRSAAVSAPAGRVADSSDRDEPDE